VASAALAYHSPKSIFLIHLVYLESVCSGQPEQRVVKRGPCLTKVRRGGAVPRGVDQAAPTPHPAPRPAQTRGKTSQRRDHSTFLRFRAARSCMKTSTCRSQSSGTARKTKDVTPSSNTHGGSGAQTGDHRRPREEDVAPLAIARMWTALKHADTSLPEWQRRSGCNNSACTVHVHHRGFCVRKQGGTKGDQGTGRSGSARGCQRAHSQPQDLRACAQWAV